MAKGTYPGDSLQRLQAAEREILAAVDVVCREEGLDYFLDGGTCLGAVRHGGFIPWDDDVDVALPLDDYLRFMEVAPSRLPGGYSLHTAENSEGFSALWCKVYKDGTRFVDENAAEAGCDQGIFVDVFPYVRLAREKDVRRRQVREALFCQRMSYLHCFAHPKVPRGTPLRGLAEAACVAVHHTVARAYRPERLFRRLLACAAWGTRSDDMVDFCYAWRTPVKESWLFPTRDVEFDGRRFRAPNDPDRFLTALYGDWHRLPPEEDRYTHLPLVLDFGDGVNVMERCQR